MGAVAQDLLEKSLRQKLNLSRLENGLVRDIIVLLDASDRDLTNQISLLYDDAASSTKIGRLRRLRQELRSVNRVAYQAVGRALSSELKEIAVRTGPRAASLLEDAVPFELSATRPSAGLLRSIVSSKPFEGKLLKGHVGNLAGNRLDAMARAIDLSLVQSESLSQALARVRGTRRGNFKDGVLEKVGRRQLEAVMRTALQHTTETANDLVVTENLDIVHGRMWISTLAARTTRICQVRDGKVWTYDPETGGWSPDGHGLEWLGGPGRAHWRCRSSGIAVLKDVDDLRAAGFDIDGLSPAERASLDGPVPVTQDFDEWLRGQPDPDDLPPRGR
jgi:hypothetical protein